MPGARMSLLFRPKRPRLRLSHGVLSGRLPRRSYATTARPKQANRFPHPYDFSREPPPRTIAVLGGGLTGLVTAYRLARLLPKSKITLYEATSRLGGWVDTEEVKDPQGRTILFERGARMVQVPRQGSLKFDDVPFYHLIEELGLGDHVVGIEKGTPYAPYIYYPDRLVQMPTPGPKTTYMGWWKIFQTLNTEPIFGNITSWLMHAVGTSKRNRHAEFAHPGENPNYYVAEMAELEPRMSLGAYYARMLGDREPVDNILSAMIHGIWGGDVWNLTAKRDPFGRASIRPLPPVGLDNWALVERGSVDAAMLLRKPDEDDLLGQEWAGFSHMWFKGGFQTLPRALAAALEKCGNVTIKTAAPVSSVRLTGVRNGIYVQDNKETALYDHVVSTLYAGTLASLTHGKLPSLDKFPAVTIQAVNLWYPTQKLNHPHTGAGYLIPQTVPHALNPEKALGVLFDSDRDLLRHRTRREGPPPNLGTTFTVLLGGHHWNGPDGIPVPANQLPTAEQAGQLAKAVVARHLGISAEHNAQAIVSTKLCRECIPQHRVDHWERMARARHELETGFVRRLTVAGPSYQMPGVFGSITAAYDVANSLAGLYPQPVGPFWKGLFPVGPTGLSRFVEPEVSAFIRKDALPLRFPAYILGRSAPTPTQRAFAYLRAKITDALRLMFHLNLFRQRLQNVMEVQRAAESNRDQRRRKDLEDARREAEILTAMRAKVAALEAKVSKAQGMYYQQKADIDATTASLLEWTEDKARRQAAAIDYLYEWMRDWHEAKIRRLAAAIAERQAWLANWYDTNLRRQAAEIASRQKWLAQWYDTNLGRLAVEIASRQAWLTHWYESNLARYEAKLLWQEERIRAMEAWVEQWNQAVAELKETQKQARLLEREMIKEKNLRVAHTNRGRDQVIWMAGQRQYEEDNRIKYEAWKKSERERVEREKKERKEKAEEKERIRKELEKKRSERKWWQWGWKE